MGKPNKRKKKNKMEIHRCRYCGSSVAVRHSSEITERLREGQYYVCSSYPECDAYVRIRPGTNLPDGEMANAHVRRKRREAHYYFDMLHQKGLMSRKNAYEWLCNLLSLPPSSGHISYLNEYDCRILIDKSIDSLRGYGIETPDFKQITGGEHDDRKAG